MGFDGGRIWDSRSFAVRNPHESRLTQTAQNLCKDDWLDVFPLEFFGTLSE
jgi:hypothetical protein